MKFSVLLPTRNRLDLLARAIETVRRQDYADWEIIVSDNHSEEDISGYIDSLNDPRIRYFRTDTFIPVTDNWNKTIEQADGEYVVMLGDDDGLMSGYFSTLAGLIEQFQKPDFVYTNAFLYAYPGVLPSAPHGFLKTYSRRRIYRSSETPFLLDRSEALGFVDDSLSFRVTFDYNMQFSVVSRKLIDRLRQKGHFYQSPYPDYYASNAMMLTADTILVVPTPLVTVGISPKSFGYYYFNDDEDRGNDFLNNHPDEELVRRVQDNMLPGSSMNNDWLFAMETLVQNFGASSNISVNYDRYRLTQIMTTFAGMISGNDSAQRRYRTIKAAMHVRERIKYGLPLSVILHLIPDVFASFRMHCFRWLEKYWGSHPALEMPKIKGEFDTILDVFESIDPKRFTTPGRMQ